MAPATAPFPKSMPFRFAAVRSIKLEPASPISGDDTPAAIMKFDVYNELHLSIADLVLAVSVLGEPGGDSSSKSRVVLVRPFNIRVSQVLQPGYSIHYELRMRNLSASCDCLPKVEVLAARVLSDVDDLIPENDRQRN
jgi:hypothetical protein